MSRADGSRFSHGQVLRLLLVEDNPLDAELIQRQIAADGLVAELRVVSSERALLKALREFDPHVVLSDFCLPGFDGYSALETVRRELPSVPLIFVSGTIGEEVAIDAVKRGAVDYLLKDNLRRLGQSIRSALRQAEAARAKEWAETMLRRSEARLQDIIDTSRDWIWECDADGRFTFSSPSVMSILGYGNHEILGRSASELVQSDDELQLQATMAELEQRSVLEKPLTLRWKHKNGKFRYLERTMVPVFADEGSLRGFRGIDRDVTLRKAQESRIRRLNRSLRFVSGASSAVMRIRDRDQLLKEACHLAVTVGGYVAATIYLLPPRAGAKPVVCSYGTVSAEGKKWSITGKLPSEQSVMTQALATGQPAIVRDLDEPGALIVARAYRKSLLARGVRAVIALPMMVDGTMIGVLELHSDEPGVFGDAELSLLEQVDANITFSLQYLQSKESAEYLEYFDALTALPNRSSYVQRLDAEVEQALCSGSVLPVLVFDVANLSIINDGLGHQAGDLVLRLIAQRLKDEFGEESLLCRLGGDRFSVASVDAHTDALNALGARVTRLFDEPFEVHDQDLRISVRAGAAQFPDDGTTADELLQRAQTALGHAKEAGETYSRHRPDMSAGATERLSLINDLRRAVADKGFRLEYQPKVEIATGVADGVEALLRWSSAQHGVVPPGVFVPIIESLGLIDEVGRWVIVQAMAEASGWFAAATGDFRVAVNASPLQLNRPDFSDKVLDLVGEHAKRLEIEVTESTLLADPRRAHANLSRLREAGVTVAIDDFGTGHSSLRVLTGLPVDVLKIDRTFVSDMTSNRSHRVIVQATITLARSLGLKTVAEGVETSEQLEMLRDLGCGMAQGYLLRRPAPAAEIGDWLAAQNASSTSESALG